MHSHFTEFLQVLDNALNESVEKNTRLGKRRRGCRYLLCKTTEELYFTITVLLCVLGEITDCSLIRVLL